MSSTLVSASLRTSLSLPFGSSFYSREQAVIFLPLLLSKFSLFHSCIFKE